MSKIVENFRLCNRFFDLIDSITDFTRVSVGFDKRCLNVSVLQIVVMIGIIEFEFNVRIEGRIKQNADQNNDRNHYEKY